MIYRVTVEGAGFRLHGREGTYAFLTHCFVDADSEELACEEAIASVKAKLDASAAVQTTTAQFHVEEMTRVAGELPAVRQQGLVWFEETDT